MQTDGGAAMPPGDDHVWQQAEAAMHACIAHGVGQLRQSVEEARARSDVLQGEKAAAERENGALAERLADAEARAADADQEVEELRSCVGLLKTDLVARKARVTSMRDKIQELEQDAARAGEHIGRLELENHDFKKVSRVVALENAFAKLEHENTRLHALLRGKKAA